MSAENIFSLSPKIRWTAFASQDGTVKFSKMRPGVKSVSPQKYDEAFMQLGPQMILAVFERLAPYAGEVGMALGRFEKVVMFVAKAKGGFLALTIDRESEAELEQTVSKIMKSIETIGR